MNTDITGGRQSLTRIRKRLVFAFRAPTGAIDLASIMVGVIILAVIAAVAVAVVVAVIPWSQNNAAQSELDAVRTAESVTMAQHQAFKDFDELVADHQIQPSTSVDAQAGGDGQCYVAMSTSATGITYFNSSTDPQVQEYELGVSTTDCAGVNLDGLVPAGPDGQAIDDLTLVKSAEPAAPGPYIVVDPGTPVVIVDGPTMIIPASAIADPSPDTSCYVALSRSGTGHIYYLTSANTQPRLYEAGVSEVASDWCSPSTPLPGLIDRIGGATADEGGNTASPAPGDCSDPNAVWAFEDDDLATRMSDAIAAATGSPAPNPLHVSDAAVLQNVWIDGTEVTSLNGIQCASNLTSLSLSDNSIADISPVYALDNVTYFEIWQNHSPFTLSLTNGNMAALSDLWVTDSFAHVDASVVNMPLLTQARFINNASMGQVTVTDNPMLDYLKVEKSASIVGNVKLANLPALATSYVDRDGGSFNLTVNNVGTLKNLSVYENDGLRKIAVSDMPNATSVSVNTNPALVDSSYTNMPALRNMYIDENSVLNTVDVPGITTVTNINLKDSWVPDPVIDALKQAFPYSSIHMPDDTYWSGMP